MAVPWSGIISGVGSLASGVLGYFGQKAANEAMLKATRETNEQNYKIWQEQQQHNIDMFNLENEANKENWQYQFDTTNAYNDPSAQVARLRAAGLNPSMAMQGGNAAGVASSSSMGSASATPAGAPQMQAPPSEAFTPPWLVASQQSLQGLMSFAQALNLNKENENLESMINERDEMLPARLRNMKVDTDHKLSDINLKRSQKNTEDIQTRIASLQYDFDAATLQSKIDLQDEITKHMRAQRIGQELNNAAQQIMNDWMPAEKQLAFLQDVAELELLYQQKDINEKQLEVLVAQKVSFYAQANAANAQAAYFGAQTELTKKQGMKVDAETESIKIDNRQKDALVDSTVKAIISDNQLRRYTNARSISYYNENNGSNFTDYMRYKSGKYSHGSSGGSLGVKIFGNGFDWHWNEEDSY